MGPSLSFIFYRDSTDCGNIIFSNKYLSALINKKTTSLLTRINNRSVSISSQNTLRRVQFITDKHTKWGCQGVLEIARLGLPPVTLPSYPHRSTLTNTAVVWNATDTANSSINKVQRFPKQRSSHRTPTPIVSQFRQEQFPCVGTNCEHTNQSARQSWVTVDPRKFLWWSRTLVSGLVWILVGRPVFGPCVMYELVCTWEH